MKSCLGTLALAVTGLAVVITVVYHASVNSELRFEPRNSQEEYINTRRSFRPQVQQPKDAKPQPVQGLQDDCAAEEVEP